MGTKLSPSYFFISRQTRRDWAEFCMFLSFKIITIVAAITIKEAKTTITQKSKTSPIARYLLYSKEKSLGSQFSFASVFGMYKINPKG